ncbi:MAG TPA: bifunctional serine/threonine-protein kinase/universal stress protein [Usitatibacter sp.]|jgi:nucleotide-binding universal stress UspA family protein|nr:bifunctional serine/threonine-protein kinase/universal stress protein [Usitatibacter sp.]
MASEVLAPPGLRPPLGAGATIGGFRIVERIHAGGTGYIYAVIAPPGRDPGFPLVMKVPAVGAGEPWIGVVAFEMELMIHPVLAGAHVPRFVAAGDLHTTPYLVMERIAGESLAACCARAPLAPEEVVGIGAEIADALHALHAQETVHHDLKPENVMLREDGTAVLLDFGFAHHARYPDLLGEQLQFEAGSAPYVSPEQLRHRRGDPRSDLFAWGAIAYELATGEPPFGTPQSLSGLRDRLWRTPVPPRARNAGVPPWLQEVILRALEPDAARRYQSAAHIAFDLRHPEQVALSSRSRRTEAPGVLRQMRGWWRARDGVLEAPPAPPRPAPVILVAVDTEHLEDARHPLIQWTARQVMSVAGEHRMMCVSVVPAPDPGAGAQLADTESGRQLEHLARLRHWVEPFGLPASRLSLHVVQASDPAATIVDLARRNHADLIVLGAPPPSVLGWWRSVASSVTASAPCSVYVVRA